MTGKLRANKSHYPALILCSLALLAASAALGQLTTQGNESNQTFEQLSVQASSARESGKIEDAIRLYQRALKLQPDWAEGWWYTGTLNYDADRYAEAIPALQRLVALSPEMGPALAFLGLSEFETRDYDNSFLHLQQAQEKGYGDDAELEKVASYHLALLCNRSGQFDRGVDALSTAIRSGHPPNEVKVALGMALLRVPLLPSELDPSKDGLVRSAGEAAVLLRIGNFNAAADALRQLVTEYPKTRYLHTAYASALSKAGNSEEALRELQNEKELAATLPDKAADVDATQRELYARGRKADSFSRPIVVETGPDDTFKALAQKAAAAQKAGQIDATLSYYQSALALRPEWEEGWRNLGTVYYITARYADAVPALRNAAAIDAHNGNVWALLGLSEFETKDYKNSLIHLERGRDLGFAGNASAVQVARYHLGILLNRNGEFDQSTELLAAESLSGPLANQVRFALGMALLRMPLLPEEVDSTNESLVRLAGETAAFLSESKYDQAFKQFEQLIKMNSHVPYLHYAYGSALASASRYDEAEAQLAEETKLSPASALPHLRRSSIALQLRNAEAAAQFAQGALQLAPDSGEGHYLLGRSLLELGKVTDSIKELEIARGLAPNSPEVRFNLARAYSKGGRPDAAEQERSAFERLNALVQKQRSGSGNQAYGAIQNQNGIRAAQSSELNDGTSTPQ